MSTDPGHIGIPQIRLDLDKIKSIFLDALCHELLYKGKFATPVLTGEKPPHVYCSTNDSRTKLRPVRDGPLEK